MKTQTSTGNIKEWLKNHSVAILATLVLAQHSGLITGLPATLLNVLVGAVSNLNPPSQEGAVL